ncbi:MAG: SdpI family protein [Anaerolineae bacterium]|nr:SdpI family protein [Anaerolineae bacterium]
MKIRKSEVAILVITALAFILSAVVYPQMPALVASHWNAQGQVDGYMSKFWGLFFLPLLLVGLALLFIAIPRIDPLRANIQTFRKYYDGFVILFFVFMIVIQVQVILWNLGIQISPNIVMPIAVGLLFFYAGILCENSKRNWFIGIRTPWTLSSDEVWAKTHRLGGKLFKLAGVITFLGAFWPNYAIWFILLPIIGVSLYTIVYSYVIYQNETKPTQS